MDDKDDLVKLTEVKVFCKEMTARQKVMYDTLIRLIVQEKKSPTVRVLADELKVSAPSVHEMLKQLQMKGYIHRDRYKHGILISGHVCPICGGTGMLIPVKISGKKEDQDQPQDLPSI